MGRSKSPDPNWKFNKKRWRRRILVRILSVVVLVLVGVAAVALWVVRALPGIAVGEISRLTNTRIEMGTCDFHRDASVSIDGIVIRPERNELFYDNTLLRAKNIYAKFSFGSILRLSPRITEIRVEEFMLDVQRDLDTGRWNVGGLRLNAAPGVGKAHPTVLLEKGRLRYCRVSGGEVDDVMTVPVEARFGPAKTVSGGYEFEIRTSKLSGGYGGSALRGSWSPGRFELAGGLSSTDNPSLERAWAVDVLAVDAKYNQQGAYELELVLKDLHSRHSPEVDTFRMMAPANLRQSGPLATFQRFFARYRPFGTVGEIRLEARGRFDALADSQITGQVMCKDISIRDRKFPYAIDHLVGPVEFTQSTATINRLTGRHGDVQIQIEGWTRGSGDNRQYQYQITSDRMALDEDLYTALRPDQKQLWDAFAPSGSIGVDYRLTRSTLFDKRVSLIVDLNDVTATYQKFPYPLTNLTGTLRFERESIAAMGLVAQRAGGRIHLDGKVTDRDTDEPIYYMVIDANDIPLDAALRHALPEKYAELYGQFDVNGVADVRAWVFTGRDINSPLGAMLSQALPEEPADLYGQLDINDVSDVRPRVLADRDANSPVPVRFLADVSLDKASLRTETLPLPVTDIAAQASVTPDSVNIQQATGRYGPGEVMLTGGVHLGQAGRPNYYHLKIATEQMPVDEALMKVLPESIRQSVSAFQIEGPVNLTVDVKKADSNEPADYAAVVECLGDKINHQQFPYPLRDVRGRVTVDSTGVTFAGLQAKPEEQTAWESASALQVDGRMDWVKGRPGDAVFSVRAQDLLFTEALGRALPEALTGVYRDLAPRGPFDVNLPTLKITRDAADRRRIEFDGEADLKTCSLQVSGAGAEVAGVLAFAGAHDAENGFSMGRLHLDADRLIVKGKNITDLQADIVYDPNARSWSAHNFLGDCHEGRVLGDFRLDPVAPGVFEYLVTASLNRVDLQQFLMAGKLGQDLEKDYSSGVLNAALSLGARVGDGSSRLGVCRVDVADMRVGKVSPLANLLAVLSLTEPSDYAFDRMLIESYLRRNRLLISRFDLSGKNLAFTGAGTMYLPEAEVDLTLTARGKRVVAAQPSILQSLTEGLGTAVVRMEVTGKADNPEVKTKTLPVIEDSLKILGTSK